MVVLNKLSRSSGFLLTAILNAANKIPTPSAEKEMGNMAKPKTKTLKELKISMALKIK